MLTKLSTLFENVAICVVSICAAVLMFDTYFFSDLYDGRIRGDRSPQRSLRDHCDRTPATEKLPCQLRWWRRRK